MKRSTIVIWVLAVALGASNLWWLFVMFDIGVTTTYQEAVFDEHHQALVELLVVAPAAADPTATRESVLSVARSAAKHDGSFEKEGFFWIGKLGYRFDESDRLIEVQTIWSPF